MQDNCGSRKSNCILRKEYAGSCDKEDLSAVDVGGSVMNPLVIDDSSDSDDDGVAGLNERAASDIKSSGTTSDE
jgi:hypothetical protein